MVKRQKYCCSTVNKRKVMEREIGGYFCEELFRSDQKLKDGKRILWFDSGRSAIRCLLDLLGNKIKRVMIPQYVCESVLKPFTEKGYQIAYYPVDRDLQLLTRDFERLLEEIKPQMVLIQSYFGFETLHKDRKFLKLLSRRGIIIVEDITHILLSGCWQPCADYMVASLRKWCSIPDGGILVKSSNKFGNDSFKSLHGEENTEFLNLRIAAQMEKRKYFLGNGHQSEDKSIFISLFDKSEMLLDRQGRYYTMSEYTRESIASIDWQSIADRRKVNYGILYNRLKNTDGIEIPFLQVPSNAVPLYFPVFVGKNKRDSLRCSMREKNILLPVIWPRPLCMMGRLTTETDRIYKEILAIPCDQRYTEQEMCYMADKIKQQMKEEDIDYGFV